MCTGRKIMCIGRQNVCTGKAENDEKMSRYLFVVCSPSFIFRSANEGLTKDNKPQINIRPNLRNIKMSKHKRLVIVIFGEV